MIRCDVKESSHHPTRRGVATFATSFLVTKRDFQKHIFHTDDNSHSMSRDVLSRATVAYEWHSVPVLDFTVTLWEGGGVTLWRSKDKRKYDRFQLIARWLHLQTSIAIFLYGLYFGLIYMVELCACQYFCKRRVCLSYAKRADSHWSRAQTKMP